MSKDTDQATETGGDRLGYEMDLLHAILVTPSPKFTKCRSAFQVMLDWRRKQHGTPAEREEWAQHMRDIQAPWASTRSGGVR